MVGQGWNVGRGPHPGHLGDPPWSLHDCMLSCNFFFLFLEQRCSQPIQELPGKYRSMVAIHFPSHHAQFKYSHSSPSVSTHSLSGNTHRLSCILLSQWWHGLTHLFSSENVWASLTTGFHFEPFSRRAALSSLTPVWWALECKSNVPHPEISQGNYGQMNRRYDNP